MNVGLASGSCGVGQAWYLAALDNKDGGTKLYRLARFREATVAKRAITVCREFSLREFLGNAWRVHRGDRDWHVEILFDSDAAPLVAETRWHHTEELERRKDGSLIFRATVSGLDEIRWWVLGWGPRATVKKPKEFVQEIGRLAEATAANYRKGGGREDT